MDTIPKLYKQYYLDKNDERKDMFKLLSNHFKLKYGLYPGSFVHITPSFYIQNMTYIDTDNRCSTFFSKTNIKSYINKEKLFKENFKIQFINADYTQKLELNKSKFDILISLYSGFVSQYCKQYLKKGRILIVNNSHGDAPLVFLDKSFELINVIKRNASYFKLSDNTLNDYFQTKDGKPINKEKIIKKMKGPGYIKSAYAYIFKKV